MTADIFFMHIRPQQITAGHFFHEVKFMLIAKLIYLASALKFLGYKVIVKKKVKAWWRSSVVHKIPRCLCAHLVLVFAFR